MIILYQFFDNQRLADAGNWEGLVLENTDQAEYPSLHVVVLDLVPDIEADRIHG